MRDSEVRKKRPLPRATAAPGAAAERIDRRRFLVRLGGSVASIVVSGAAVGAWVGCERPPVVRPGEGVRWSVENPLPNAEAAVAAVPGTRPELTPLEDHYQIFNNPDLPSHDLRNWHLQVSGLVAEPLVWRLADITRHEPRHAFVTLSCISNPVGGPLISTTRWTGTSLQQLLPLWHLQPAATHLKIHGADGFYESLALETIQADPRVMLAYAWDGVPLPMKHGFPLRLYVPSRYGMKQPKWIVSIEAMDRWEPGYSVVNTWDQDAIMKTTAVIDTVLVDAEAADGAGPQEVQIGGIAHAGARGISKVEVRVDDGAWQEAALRTPLSDLTWVLWRHTWPFAPGEHTFSVRAYDGTGALQEEAASPPYPDGATGIHQKTEALG